MRRILSATIAFAALALFTAEMTQAQCGYGRGYGSGRGKRACRMQQPVSVERNDVDDTVAARPRRWRAVAQPPSAVTDSPVAARPRGWRARGERWKPGVCRAVVDCPRLDTARTQPATALSAAESEALRAALLDEYTAQWLYAQINEQFGTTRRIQNLHDAEGRHAEALEALCTRYEVDAPGRDDVPDAELPDTFGEAIALAIEHERGNDEMYADLLDQTTNEDLRAVFERLQTVSRTRHLPALEGRSGRGQNQGSGRGPGAGIGRGVGRGDGAGLGRGADKGRGAGRGWRGGR